MPMLAPQWQGMTLGGMMGQPRRRQAMPQFRGGGGFGGGFAGPQRGPMPMPGGNTGFPGPLPPGPIMTPGGPGQMPMPRQMQPFEDQAVPPEYQTYPMGNPAYPVESDEQRALRKRRAYGQTG